MQKWQSKVVEVKAEPILSSNVHTLANKCSSKVIRDGLGKVVGIDVVTLEGRMQGLINEHYLIQGTEGEFYPCKVSVFHNKYRKIGM